MPGQHLVVGPFQSHADYLSDEDYARALDALVIATVDVMLMRPTGEIVLAKRTLEPALGKFETPGGRMRPGESFGQTAVRNTKRELGITLEPDRFHYAGTNSFVWAVRALPPENHGSHTISTAMVVQLTDEEADAVRLNDENSETMWISPQEVVARSQEFEGAVVVQICKDYLANQPADR